MPINRILEHNGELKYYDKNGNLKSFESLLAGLPAHAQSHEAGGDDEISVSITRVAVIKTIADDDDLTVGDGIYKFTVAEELDGYKIVSVGAHVYTASTSGLPTVQINNITKNLDILSTRITIDVNEKDSKTAATPAVINQSNNTVNHGDEIRIDVDIAGTGTKGLEVRMGLRK
jgi:hypothetical protein